VARNYHPDCSLIFEGVARQGIIPRARGNGRLRAAGERSRTGSWQPSEGYTSSGIPDEVINLLNEAVNDPNFFSSN
jgi:hypothetical protein